MASPTKTEDRPIVTRAMAKAAGAKRYFTSNPCPAGHIGDRWVSTGSCVTCIAVANTAWATANRETLLATRRDAYAANPEPHRARSLEWAMANPGKVRANRIAYRLANPEKGPAKCAAWRAANPERHRSSFKVWRLANLDKVRISLATWRAANLEKIRVSNNAWRARNPDKVHATNARKYAKNPAKYRAQKKAYAEANPEQYAGYNRNRRALKTQAGGKHTANDIKKLLTIQHGKCAHAWCATRLASGYHVDHIVPLAKGGSNGRRNLQLLCQPCNLKKGAHHPIDFAQRHGLLL